MAWMANMALHVHAQKIKKWLSEINTDRNVTWKSTTDLKTRNALSLEAFQPFQETLDNGIKGRVQDKDPQTLLSAVTQPTMHTSYAYTKVNAHYTVFNTQNTTHYAKLILHCVAHFIHTIFFQVSHLRSLVYNKTITIGQHWYENTLTTKIGHHKQKFGLYQKLINLTAISCQSFSDGPQPI